MEQEPGTTVGELGERGVLARILARLGAASAASIGPGDDCAVLHTVGDTVVTSDTMIEGPDFRLAWHSGFELGWKLAATNLSDVAAMGATPIGLTVALACPRETPVHLLEEIAAGLDAACRELAPGCGVVGGDLGRAPVLTAAVTALGDLAGRAPVLRTGARVGEVVAYAGDLGLAGIGVSLLFAEASDPAPGAVPDAAGALRLDERIAHDRTIAGLRERRPAALAAQLAPRPPIPLGVSAADAGATAMLDVSDGLALDAARIARGSGVALDLDPGLLRSAFGVQRGERVPLAAMLWGGEDHGLLACFPEGARLPEGFHAIGRVVGLGAASEDEVLLGGGPVEARGWDPYAGVTGASF